MASSSSLSTKMAAAIPSASGGTSYRIDRAPLAGCLTLVLDSVDFDSSCIRANSCKHTNKVIDRWYDHLFTSPPCHRDPFSSATPFPPHRPSPLFPPPP